MACRWKRNEIKTRRDSIYIKNTAKGLIKFSDCYKINKNEHTWDFESEWNRNQNEKMTQGLSIFQKTNKSLVMIQSWKPINPYKW